MAFSSALDVPFLQRRSVVTIGLVVAVVLGLYFIPDILGIYSVRSGEDNEDFVSEGQHGLNIQTASPLERLSAMIDAGYFDKKASLAPEASLLPSLNSGANLSGEEVLTWKNFKTQPAHKSLLESKKITLSIASKLSENNNAALYGLYNFANGINFVLSEGKKRMTVGQALYYLEGLHANATAALLRGKVDSALLANWSKMPLDKVFDSGRVALVRQRIQASFKPSLYLTSVAMRENRKGTFGGLRVKGYVKVVDLKTIELYRNGIFIRRIAKTRKRMSNGELYYNFYFNDTHDVSGVYTLRVLDRQGNIFQKSYEFLKRSRRFQKDRTGYYRFPYREPDRHFDDLFKTSSGTRSEQQFTTF